MLETVAHPNKANCMVNGQHAEVASQSHKMVREYSSTDRTARIAAFLFPVSLAAPSSFSLILGALTIPRLLLFCTLFLSLRALIKKVHNNTYVFVQSDFFVPLLSTVMVVATCLHFGPKGLVQLGTVTALEFSFSYLLGRTLFGNRAGYRVLVKSLRFAVVAIILLSLLDTVTSTHFVGLLGSKLSGRESVDVASFRFGIIRAQGPLEHPILLGMFLVICGTLFYHSHFSAVEKIVWIMICVFGSLLPISSATFLSEFLILAIVFYIRNMPARGIGIGMLIAVGVYVLVIFFSLVDDPLPTLLQNLTIDPQTGLFRIEIWKWAGLNISEHPWFGVAPDDLVWPEYMPPSVDSLWLVFSMNYGLPALALLVVVLFTSGLTFIHSRRKSHYAGVTLYKYGVCIGIFIYAFDAFTVDLWGANWTVLGLLIGMRAGFTEYELLPLDIRAEAANISLSYSTPAYRY